MKVLSLFDGMSGCRLALDMAGLGVSKYYTSEIDKYATQVSEHNYPDSIRLGDVTQWEDWDINWASIDLVTAGFPCQSWSMAGQQLGDKDDRGVLFWTTLDIISKVLKHNPNAKFLLENVKMKKEFEEYITHHATTALGYVEKTLINSALVSAQNRNRYYWTNFPVSQPVDKGIIMADITQGCRGLVVRASVQKNAEHTYNGKCPTLTASAGMGGGNVPLMAKEDVASLYKGKYIDKDVRTQFRKLTPLECERLQTIPDNYTLVLNKDGKQLVSNSQRYKMIGNGWTIAVISHILRGLK